MRARLIFACAAAGIATSAFGVAAAHAETSGSIGFLPGVVRPGQHLQIFGKCDHPEFTTSPVISSVLDAEDIYGRDTPDGMSLISNATVKNEAKPGTWPVSYQCGPKKVTGYVKVIDTRTREPYSAIGIQDREIKPGQEVMVVASCQDPDFRSSKVVSPVLTAPDLVRKDGELADTPLIAFGRIHKNARPGTYPISFTCVGKKVSDKFTVLGDVEPAAKKAQVPVKPKGAAETGAIDSQVAESQTAEGATDAGVLAVGAGGVLLASAGVGLWAYRRRRAG